MYDSSAIAKLKKLAREDARNRGKRDMAVWRDTAMNTADFQLERERYSPNTMGPHEEVMHTRRKRNYVNTGRATRPARNILGENLFLLAILGISIYGLYKLSIYLLANV